MASIVVAGDTSGSITLAAPAVAGTTVLTLPTTSATIATNVNGDLYPLTSGTSVTASGTSVTFTGIPSWAKRITVMLNGVSTNGTSNTQIQLGDSGGIENTGYTGSLITAGAAANTAFSAGFLTTNLIASADTQNGLITIVNMTGNTWVTSIVVGQTGTLRDSHGGGVKTLTDTLTQIRITTVNGTDTFDAGSINILYE